MYGSIGFLTRAQEVFDSLSSRNVVSWNALITGYIKHGSPQEALDYFEQMQCDDVSPDLVTFVSCLKACGRLGVSQKGCEIHDAIAREGLEKDVFIGSALIDMYCNCGILSRAQEVFDSLATRDVATWNTLIAGYAQLGDIGKVLSILNEMLERGKSPGIITLVSVLNACSHAGLVDKGCMCLLKWIENCGKIPTLEHNNCVVDLLGRAGQLNEALLLIESMPFLPNLVVWHTALSACRKWSNVKLGTHIFEHALELDDKDLSAYFYMSNIFLDAPMQEDAEMP
jgi:pentatricopeptide repeat protein